MEGEWFRWGISVTIGVGGLIVGALFRRIFDLIDGKANKLSTDKRFDDMLNELKEMRSDQRAHVVHDDKIQTELLNAINETRVSIATLTATINERLPQRAHNGH